MFICEGDANLTFPKSKDYTFEKNIIIAKGTVKFSQAEAITAGAGNIIFATAIEGTILGVTEGDPLISGAEEGKIVFGEGSPAGELGIEAIDVSGAGATLWRISRTQVLVDPLDGGRADDDIDLIRASAAVDF